MQRQLHHLLTALLPQAPELLLDQLDVTPQAIVISLTSTCPCAPCPDCGTPSLRVRGRYLRRLADLPWGTVPVKLLVQVRKFACPVTTCHRRIFTERLPLLGVPYARRTVRLNEAVQRIGFALGGAAGSRVLDHLHMAASPSTIVRRIRQAVLPPRPTPQVLGVDEWARRKGRTYSTILVDLEQHRPMDLLPDHSSAAFAAWLRAHPGVQIISRDRAGAYAEGATLGAPTAVQIADRWHLLRNLGDALERAFDQQRSTITHAFAPEAIGEARPPVDAPAIVVAQRDQHRSLQRRAARLERYTTVRTLQQQGVSLHAIARHLRLSRRTVQKYVRATAFPEHQRRRPAPSRLDPYKPYMLTRWNDGCHNGTQLWREIAAQGYGGGRSIVLDYIARLREAQGLPARAHHTRRLPPPIPTPRQLTWLVLRRPDARTPSEQDQLQQLRAADPLLDQAVQFAHEFAAMVRQRQHTALEAWLWQVANSRLTALQRFAAGIQRDKAAVLAALREPWSQGQVEGQITRLKLIKRSMYGRANFDLLRLRVLHPP